MTHVAIRADRIGKTYRIQAKQEPYRTLRDYVSHAIAAPLRSVPWPFRVQNNELRRKNSAVESFDALRDLTFEIQAGEAVGIIGRNGAGKSTLLKILSRITEPSAGSAMIDGRVASLLEVGTGFHMELTGRENVYLNGAILGMRKAEIQRKFDEIVAFAEVEKFIDTPVKHYSSGMQLRLAFAVAAHLEPEILLIDEVLAVGDARFQKKCLRKMEDVGHQGRTVLFISHNMSAVTRLCHRCLLLENGTLKKDGPSHEVVGMYLHSESGTTACREWSDPAKAPCGTVARLRAVIVRNHEDRVSDAVDIRLPVTIEMTYEVLRRSSILLPFFMFYNEEGILAFAANDLDPNWRGQQRPAGEYTSSVHVPGNLLAEGTLFVGAGITREGNGLEFYEGDAVAFHVIDSLDGNSARGDYGGNMTGIVRPMLQWTTKFEKVPRCYASRERLACDPM